MQIGRAVVLALLLQFVPDTAFPRADKPYQLSLVAYDQGSSIRISLRSTDRLPEASGTVRVERQGGRTEVEVELDSIKPASLFGGDYNTYILWVASRDCQVENIGEFELNGTHGSVHASTNLETFAILVTAEPHFLVEAKSIRRPAHQAARRRLRSSNAGGVGSPERAMAGSKECAHQQVWIFRPFWSS